MNEGNFDRKRSIERLRKAFREVSTEQAALRAAKKISLPKPDRCKAMGIKTRKIPEYDLFDRSIKNALDVFDENAEWHSKRIKIKTRQI